MTRVLSSIRESLAALGWANGLLDIFARALDKATRGRCRLFKYYFVAQPVPLQSAVAPAGESKTRIHQASPGEGIIAKFPRPPEIIARRFADGAVCFVAERAGKLVGFIWIKREDYWEDEVRCQYVLQPAARLAWDFDAYVAPEFRMSRAFAQLWEAANRFLRDHGCEWTVSRISAFNAASLAAHRRLGIVHLHTGVFVAAGPMQFAVFTCSPYLHIAVSRARCPRLVFGPPAERSEG
jgi:GNAT superfamily N-acetyltransferase